MPARISKGSKKLCKELRENLNKLQSVVKEEIFKQNNNKKPPYCGGHWIADMARIVDGRDE